MNPVKTVAEVFDAIQQAKAGAADFRTNFFPVPAKLQGWIDHGELVSEIRENTVVFFRRDRDFRHLYFCAPNLPELQAALVAMSPLKTERMVTDLVGNEISLAELFACLENAGFRRYLKLQRMARTGQGGDLKSEADNLTVTCAETSDSRAILELLESLFDHFGEQIPVVHEVEAAAAGRQILIVKSDGLLAGLLFFETQGFASTVRFWAVAKRFRAAGVGSALMRHYLRAQTAVRRFTLWVKAGNQNAIQKYGHYGYAADGLVDHVLANEMIPNEINR
jgi:ribosomal protein S18 acetylase RimI-like enzyme